MNELRSQPHVSTRWIALVAPWLIMVAAIAYYGSYINFWFNPHDEGGTAALNSMRLMRGEAPIRDVELGYNVGWFWPIAGLFKVAGVNFLLMRGYFFFLSTIAAVLGWLTVRKVTRNEWLALLAGLALVVFPGSQFKNYIPLLCIANTLCVLTAALCPPDAPRGAWWRAVLGGVVLGLTLLIRIDLGYLFALLWLGFLLLRLFDTRQAFASRIKQSAGALACLIAAVAVTHTPALVAASAGGYEKLFIAQYGAWARSITGRAQTAIGSQPAAPGKPKAPKPTGHPVVDRTTLQRVSLADATAFKTPDKTVLFALTYLPPIVYALLLAWCGWGIFGAMRRGTFALDQAPALILLALIGSLATFPQFFFFRPDRPHLSEFMPGYIVATLCSVALLGGAWRWLLGALLAIQFSLFGWYALDHYSAGTIAARTNIKKSKRIRFEGANGVRVWVHKEKDYPELEGVRRAVVEHSKPGDWLVCYPYQPGYNVMTDRPTYQHQVYQDNATTTAAWPRLAIKELEEKKPAVVIVDDRAINRTESSRFSVWAKPAYDYVKANYDACGTFDTVQVFALKTPSHP